MANEQKPTKAVETKRIVGTNLYRALAEFETAVRAGWALEPRGTTTVGSIVYINLVRGGKVSKEDEVVITETPLDAEIKDGIYKAESVSESEVVATVEATEVETTVDVPVKKSTRKVK
ncbi:MAG: hypothetical protein KBT03_13140 [Bacteroidales bacterium]|nr:hypothetical protein [Candidatus Scybalousia scybalohippi]